MKIVAARDDIERSDVDPDSKSFSSRLWRLFLPRPRPRNYYLKGLTGPVLALEYLENGTFGRLMRKARSHDLHLPNRVLWSLFLCRESHPRCVQLGFCVYRQFWLE